MKEKPQLSHLDERGKAKMVDVSDKEDSLRTAVAKGRITMQPATLERICAGDTGKGDVFAAARIAGIMAAKRTGETIPLCHPLSLTAIDLKLEAVSGKQSFIEMVATVRSKGPTGVEMEALHAVAVACLTIYDMAKAIDRGMEIGAIHLQHKSGGKGGDWSAS